MVEFFRALYAALAALPLFGFAVVYAGIWFWKRDGRWALERAADVAVVFLFSSVSVLWNGLTGSPGFVLALLLFLLLCLFWWVVNRRGEKRVGWRRWFRSVWRSSFLLFALIYLVLFILELAQTIKNGA